MVHETLVKEWFRYAEMDLASARSDYISAVVNVCMALGGGWHEDSLVTD